MHAFAPAETLLSVFTLGREQAINDADPVSDDDRHIIERVNGGDREAFSKIVARYQRDISVYMWRFTRDHIAWEELVQEVFVEAYFSIGKFRGEAPLLHWLKKIATRVGYRHWKKNARARSVPMQPLDDYVEGKEARTRRPDESGDSELVHLMLAQLPPRDRLVLTLLYLEGRSTEEASEMCGWSHSLVRVQAFRAKRKLKKLLEAYYENVKSSGQ